MSQKASSRDQQIGCNRKAKRVHSSALNRMIITKIETYITTYKWSVRHDIIAVHFLKGAPTPVAHYLTH